MHPEISFEKTFSTVKGRQLLKNSLGLSPFGGRDIISSL